MGHRVEAEIIPLGPHQLLANVEQIGQKKGNTLYIVTGETKESVVKIDGRGQRGGFRELSPNPGIPALDQRAGEKEVLQAFGVITTKTRGLERIAERSKAGCGVEHPMGD